MNYYACIWCFLAGSVVLVSGFFFWIKTDERSTKAMSFAVFRWSSTYGIRLVPTDLDNCVEDDIEHGFSLDRPRLIINSTVLHRDQSGEQSESVEFYCFLNFTFFT